MHIKDGAVLDSWRIVAHRSSKMPLGYYYLTEETHTKREPYHLRQPDGSDGGVILFVARGNRLSMQEATAKFHRLFGHPKGSDGFHLRLCRWARGVLPELKAVF